MKIAKKYIKASIGDRHTSSVSFDFIHDGSYDFHDLSYALYAALDRADVKPTGIDFREVDYSTYPEYKDSIITQCGMDFEWVDFGMRDEPEYIADDIEAYIAEALEQFGYELIGIDFYSAE